MKFVFYVWKCSDTQFFFYFGIWATLYQVQIQNHYTLKNIPIVTVFSAALSEQLHEYEWNNWLMPAEHLHDPPVEIGWAVI